MIYLEVKTQYQGSVAVPSLYINRAIRARQPLCVRFRDSVRVIDPQDLKNQEIRKTGPHPNKWGKGHYYLHYYSAP